MFIVKMHVSISNIEQQLDDDRKNYGREISSCNGRST